MQGKVTNDESAMEALEMPIISTWRNPAKGGSRDEHGRNGGRAVISMGAGGFHPLPLEDARVRRIPTADVCAGVTLP